MSVGAQAPSISQVENDPVRPGRSEPEIHTKDAAETSVERIRARKGGRDRRSYIRLSTASDTAVISFFLVGMSILFILSAL